MSTHAFIGHRIDGGVRGIYLHQDGYIDWAGRLLVQHHNSLVKCERLVHNGQIRGLDSDGSIDLFDEGDYEEYGDVQEVLENGFQYCYIFEGGSWVAYHLNKERKVEILEIPGNAKRPEHTDPAERLNQALRDFTNTSNAKYGSYAHAAGYLTGVLIRLAQGGPLGEKDVHYLVRELNQATKENKQ